MSETIAVDIPESNEPNEQKPLIEKKKPNNSCMVKIILFSICSILGTVAGVTVIYF